MGRKEEDEDIKMKEEEEEKDRRPEESPRQTSRQAGKQAGRQAKRARSPHEWLGCRTEAMVVGVGACSRPAAASFTILFPSFPSPKFPVPL